MIDTGKIGIILLAAGNSIRYSGIKLLDIISGKKMYLHILKRSSLLSASPKIIVTQYQEIQDIASHYGFEAVMNYDPQLGISHSLKLGLQMAIAKEPDLEGVMFGVCDQPYLEQSTMEHLITTFLASDKNIACVSNQGSMGNPCIFGKIYFEELLALTGDVGGKKVIKNHPEDVEQLIVENELELLDIDLRIN